MSGDEQACDQLYRDGLRNDDFGPLILQLELTGRDRWEARRGFLREPEDGPKQVVGTIRVFVREGSTALELESNGVTAPHVTISTIKPMVLSDGRLVSGRFQVTGSCGRPIGRGWWQEDYDVVSDGPFGICPAVPEATPPDHARAARAGFMALSKISGALSAAIEANRPVGVALSDRILGDDGNTPLYLLDREIVLRVLIDHKTR